MEFNVKIHCEIDVKLVFHEILGKKNSTAYPSLYKFRNIHNKTPGLKSLCNKVAGLKAFQNDEEMSLLVFS